jgi:hypothetical protein
MMTSSFRTPFFTYCRLFFFLSVLPGGYLQAQPPEPPAEVTARGILLGAYEEYLKDNPEYRSMRQVHDQSQITIDSCHRLLEKSALTIRNSSFSRSQKKRVLAVIEAAKNDVSGDIYGQFKYFDDPFMNRVKKTIRVPTLYECEIAILKAKGRIKKAEKWSELMALMINKYYLPEFQRYELIRKASTYYEMLGLEMTIDSLTELFQQNASLPNRADTFYKDVLFRWSLNRPLLRQNDLRESLYQYMERQLQEGGE